MVATGCRDRNGDIRALANETGGVGADGIKLMCSDQGIDPREVIGLGGILADFFAIDEKLKFFHGTDRLNSVSDEIDVIARVYGPRPEAGERHDGTFADVDCNNGPAIGRVSMAVRDSVSESALAINTGLWGKFHSVSIIDDRRDAVVLLGNCNDL